MPPLHVERALVVVAHPDDVDFGAAGTVARWVAEGIEVTYCLVTDGDAGGFDDTPRSEMAGLRRAEQTAAAAVVGVTDLRFLGHPDGQVYPTLAMRRDISRVIRQVRPQRVLTQSPDLYLDRLPASHPDHRATGAATIDAVYPDARNPFAHPELLADEGLEAWTVRELWLMGAPDAGHVVDITEVFDTKMTALRSHVSQVSHNDGLDTMMRGWGTMVARAGGLPDGRLGEVFRMVPIPS
ncbi:MAG: PIG-L family deacetylase [Geodermatophilaceae bacterium]|nr:PIG-L family deacetylase [Geodermatophilaceae bacterium]